MMAIVYMVTLWLAQLDLAAPSLIKNQSKPACLKTCSTVIANFGKISSVKLSCPLVVCGGASG